MNGTKFHVLVLGATYGSLLATKLLLAGNDVTLVCLSDEARLINEEGTRLRMPTKATAEPVEICSNDLPGRLVAARPDEIAPSGFDLVVLAMQEPQYRAHDVRELLGRVVEAQLPCMSIMNMPPLAFLRRLPAVDAGELAGCYVNADVWDMFDPKLMTLASPDPQAFRPPEEPANFLQVSLPTNFKVARFHSDRHTKILKAIAAGIEAVRFETGGGQVELPVKLKVHGSVFVPLAKWSMLMTGNYRCISKHRMQSIRDAVHGDLSASRKIYDWVGSVCRGLGASTDDLVPFEKYANAASGLSKPSSAARALLAGAARIERVDKLVKNIAGQFGEHLDEVDEIVEVVDAWLLRNSSKAA